MPPVAPQTLVLTQWSMLIGERLSNSNREEGFCVFGLRGVRDMASGLIGPSGRNFPEETAGKVWDMTEGVW